MQTRWEKDERKKARDDERRRLRLVIDVDLHGNTTAFKLHVNEPGDLRILRFALNRLLRPVHFAWALSRLRIVRE